MSNDDQAVRDGFAARLRDVCREKDFPDHGRQSALARQFGVTPKAARKWLTGESLPELATAVRIAEWAGVNSLWLLQGSGPKVGERVDTRALVLDEAVRALPSEARADLLDSLRSKLIRYGRLSAADLDARYSTMLDAYERERGGAMPPRRERS